MRARGKPRSRKCRHGHVNTPAHATETKNYSFETLTRGKRHRRRRIETSRSRLAAGGRVGLVLGRLRAAGHGDYAGSGQFLDAIGLEQLETRLQFFFRS